MHTRNLAWRPSPNHRLGTRGRKTHKTRPHGGKAACPRSLHPSPHLGRNTTIPQALRAQSAPPQGPADCGRSLRGLLRATFPPLQPQDPRTSTLVSQSSWKADLTTSPAAGNATQSCCSGLGLPFAFSSGASGSSSLAGTEQRSKEGGKPNA